MIAAIHPADHPVEIHLPDARVIGHLQADSDSRGIVIFANGVGAGRFIRRDEQIACLLHRHGLATLVLKLVSPEEEGQPEVIFDIGMLAERLARAIDWIAESEWMSRWPVGLIGAGTGAGAALVAAALRPGQVDAVVCRGGRPDLALAWLDQVEAATLLIVGGADAHVAGLNQMAMERLSGCTRELVVIPGASHLFPEPGAIDAVARLAKDWFVRHLNGGGSGNEQCGSHG